MVARTPTVERRAPAKGSPDTRDGMSTWIARTFYALASGTIATACAYLVGDLAIHSGKSRDAIATVLQLGVTLAVVGTAGVFTDTVVGRVTRDLGSVFHRRSQHAVRNIGDVN
jgi:hypothetical protein